MKCFAMLKLGRMVLRIRFRPGLVPTLATIVAMAVMVKLGFWQYGKAQAKASLQHTYDLRAGEVAVVIPATVGNIEDWRYRKVKATGHYLPAHQVLLDNQVEGEQAGYHVITPFQAESGAVVLVDRGWIPVGDRSRLPEIQTPAEALTVQGFSWIPSTKYFELMPPDNSSWQPVWQNLNLARYNQAASLKVLPFVIRLDADSPAGGFVRNWVPPADRMEQHLSYALQWWGFAATLFVIWVFVNIKKETS